MGDVGVVSDVLRQGGRQGAVGPVLIRYNSTIIKARRFEVLRPFHEKEHDLKKLKEEKTRRTQ